MEDDRNRTFPVNEIRLCIDSCGEDIEGRLYNKMQKEPIVFHGFGEMLLRADALFDRYGYPQAFQEKRNFKGNSLRTIYFAVSGESLDDEEMEKQTGKTATMDILVRSRRRSSWQGYLIPYDNGRVLEFQSEMGLLKCICKELRKRRCSMITGSDGRKNIM